MNKVGTASTEPSIFYGHLRLMNSDYNLTKRMTHAIGLAEKPFRI